MISAMYWVMGSPNRTAFCIYTDTLCQGPIPAWRDEHGNPVIYSTLIEAQREIADNAIERLQQFLDGDREFEDAMTVDDYVVEVDVQLDGSIIDENGNRFGPGTENW
jgi:hypothetical protein